MMNGARRVYYQQQLDAATGQVQRLQDTQQKLLQRHGGAAPAAAPAPANAPAAAPPNAAKPLTDVKQVQKYLQQAGGDKVKARKLAAADGWSF